MDNRLIILSLFLASCFPEDPSEIGVYNFIAKSGISNIENTTSTGGTPTTNTTLTEEECSTKFCSTELSNCESNNNCLLLVNCLSDCIYDNCIQSCINYNSKGYNIFNQLKECMYSNDCVK